MSPARKTPTGIDSGDGRPRSSAIGEPDPMVYAYLREWRMMPSPMPGVMLWACIRGGYQYVMSYNTRHKHWGASAKLADRTTPGRQRIDFGFRFSTREEAEQACEQHQLQTRN